MKKPKKAPNPGTEEAIAAGCLCPVLDNHHGEGYYGQPGVFAYKMDCPLHVEELKKAKPRRKK